MSCCCYGVLSGVGNSRVRDLSNGEFSGSVDATGGVVGTGNAAGGVYCRAREGVGVFGFGYSGVLGEYRRIVSLIGLMMSRNRQPVVMQSSGLPVVEQCRDLNL